jgi:hypothetical protein
VYRSYCLISISAPIWQAKQICSFFLWKFLFPLTRDHSNTFQLITAHSSLITVLQSQLTVHKSRFTDSSSQFTDHRSPFTDLLSVVTKERRLINFFKHPPAPLESVLSSSFNISHPKRRPNKKCFSSFHMENGNIRTS